jgi:hypothetical protein
MAVNIIIVYSCWANKAAHFDEFRHLVSLLYYGDKRIKFPLRFFYHSAQFGAIASIITLNKLEKNGGV